MKTIIIYTSKTGFTKKYAEWIAEELECEAVSMNEIEEKSLAEYDCIVYGGGLMAGKIAGLEKMKTMISKAAEDAKLVVYATGATPMNAAEIIEKIPETNFKSNEEKSIPFFYFEGGLDYDNMGFVGRNMMKMMRKSLEKKKDMTEDNAAMIAHIAGSYDGCTREYIKPLTDKVKEFSIV